MTITNLPEPLSVSELSQHLKRTLETTYDFVRVRGELSKISMPSSGHLYTDIKDVNATINAVCWKGKLATLSIQPKEGLEVICTGKITTYPARSNYQLVIESMELAGQGAMLKMLEDQKKRLEAEGLFDPSRKKPLPVLPRRIGIITSPTGAVIRDILHRLEDRFPCHVLVWPATVQGANTVRDVTAGIKAFCDLPSELKPDVLIIARGGGSFEDLMPFNDESLVRAVASCTIPLISAVGHETDTTQIDFVSDRRAPTPTAAAEMAVPVLSDLVNNLSISGQRLHSIVTNRLKHDRNALRIAHQAMGDPMTYVNMHAQKLDNIGLQQALKNLVAKLSQRFARLQGGLRHPRQQIEHAAGMLHSMNQRLETAMSNRLTHYKRDLSTRTTGLRAPYALIAQAQERLDGSSLRIFPLLERYVRQVNREFLNISSLLDSFSYKKILERGYAVIRTTEGDVITSAQDAQKQMALKIEFSGENRVLVRVEGQNE